MIKNKLFSKLNIKDYNNQLDDTANTSYNDILSSIDYLGEVDIKDN